MNKALALGIAAAIGLAGQPATAGDTAGMKYFVFPRLEAVWVDRDRDLDDGFQLGLGFGVGVNERWNFEFNLYRGWHDGPPTTGNADFTAFTVNGLRIFYPEAKASPYFLLGAGLLSKDLRATGRSEDAIVEAGIGLLIDTFEKDDGSRKLQIRPELRSRWDLNEGSSGGSTFSDFIAGVSFQYAFGPARVEEVRAAEPPPPPAPPPPPPPPPRVDSDGDGVYDDVDRCPNTPPGVKVDEIGCFVEATLRVNFAFDSSEISAADKAEIDRAVVAIKDRPAEIAAEVKYEVAGHTDSVGSEAYNQRLSERRANAVRDRLIAEGIPAAQVTAVGYGESRPRASNDTDEGRAENRRVVITATR
jgi:OmpA-OmpF porin, OOP family